MVRLLSKFGFETSTRGYRPVKIVATQDSAATAVMTKAQPLLRASTNTTAATIATIPIAAGTAGPMTPRSLRSTATATVQTRNAATTTATGTHSRRAVAAARSHSAPLVRRVRN